MQLAYPQNDTRAETLRYLGAGGWQPDAASQVLLQKAEDALRTAATPRGVWKQLPLTALPLQNAGNDIARHLRGCDAMVLMAVTLGSGADTLMRRLELTDIALAAVVDAVPVGQAIVSPVTADSDYYQDFLDALADRGVTPVAGQAGMQFPLGEAKCTVLGPAAAGSDLNNSSLVLQVRFGGATFLFMGDAGAEEERSLIQSGADVSCDVLAVGHHGSGSATGYVFLRQALPKYAVISVGAGNRYGHPAESTLSRLRDAGCTVYRTDQSGTITIVTDKNGKIRCPA